MNLTEYRSDLVVTCQAELGRLLSGFEAAPSSSGLFDIGAVAEIAVLGDGVPEIEPIRQILCDSAARWLRSGVLEDLCFPRVELTYTAALLAYLAQRSRGFSPGDMAVMKRLCEGGLIGRSEVPVLTQRLIAAYLTRCGIETDFGDLGRRDLMKMIDKRVLRVRSDEYDLLVVLMCAQLLRMEEQVQRPAIYPQVLLVQAIRSGNANWLPVLAFVCAQSFSLDEDIRKAALESILERMPARGELLPAPRGVGIDSEYIGRAERGLRIRSTAALILSLCTLGDLHDEDRACIAFD